MNAGADPDAIEADIRQKVVGFLHPAHGGPDGTGWQLGQSVFTANLFQAITLPADLGYISDLQIRPDIPAYHFPPLNPGGHGRQLQRGPGAPVRAVPGAGAGGAGGRLRAGLLGRPGGTRINPIATPPV